MTLILVLDSGMEGLDICKVQVLGRIQVASSNVGVELGHYA